MPPTPSTSSAGPGSRLPSIKTSSPPTTPTSTTPHNSTGRPRLPTSSTRSSHPMMSYYVPPPTSSIHNNHNLPSSSSSSPISGYSGGNLHSHSHNHHGHGTGAGHMSPSGHLGGLGTMGGGIGGGYGTSTSGFTIPTSNSRPTSPTAYDMDRDGQDDTRFGSVGGPWGSAMNGNGLNGSSSSSSSSLHLNQKGHPLALHSNSTSNANSNREPPNKKRRLSSSNPSGSGSGSTYHLPPPASSVSHTQPSHTGSNFLAGLRGASDLPAPTSVSNHNNHTNSQQQMDEDDDEDGDSGDDSDMGDDDGRGGSANPSGGGNGSASGRGGGKGGEDDGDRGGKGKKKMKLTRGSRACTVCRRLKMKCVEADIDNGVRCLRCRNGNLECVFEESMRGKRSSKGKKSEIMAKNLKEMENTLDTVLRSLHNPKLSLASGMTNLSPSASSGMLDGSPGHAGSKTLDITSPGKELMGADQLDAHTSYTDMSVSHPARPGISPLGGGGGGESSTGSPMMGRPGVGLSRMNTSTSNVNSGESGHAVAGSSIGGSKIEPPSPRLHSLPDNTLNPLGLLAEASLQNRKRSSTNANASNSGAVQTIESGLNGADALKSRVGGNKVRTRESSVDEAGNPKRLGVGDASYFRPGPMSSLGLRRVIIERELKPEIFSFTSAAQINELFDIYFDQLHPNVPVLNKELHTPAGVCARSPFLLTTICAIASRFHPKHSGLRPKLAAVAKKLMFESPARGYKSLEIVQAYLLLVNWTLGPEERWEQDLSYLLLGMAIRIGTDMNLYKKNVVMPLDTEEGRLRDIEIANRERTWLLCFIHDRSQSAQMGRPYSIREDMIVRESRYPSWFTRASSQPEDVVLAAYADMQRIMSRALDALYSQQVTNSSGLVPGVDYPLVVNAVLDQLDGWLREWQFPLVEPTNDEITVNMQILYRAMADFYHQYNSLVLSSFALQYAIETSPLDLPIWFSKVHTAAMGVLTVVKVEIAPRGLLPSFTDGQLVMLCYACLSLLKLVRPEFKQLNREPQTILNFLNEAIDTLNAAAIDEAHSVGLYATLLRNLVGNKQEELRTDFNAAEKERRTTRHSRSATTLATVCNGALTMRGNEDEGLLWNPYSGLGIQSLPQPAQSMPGLNGAPVIVPDNAVSHPQSDMPGSAIGAMNGTIWPHAAVSSAPTPTAEVHPDPSSQNGMQDTTSMFMDGLGAVSYGLEDINWENSLLMPGFGGFGQLELSGGFVHTQFGSGIISPNIGMTPAHSRPASPRIMMQQPYGNMG